MILNKELESALTRRLLDPFNISSRGFRALDFYNVVLTR